MVRLDKQQLEAIDIHSLPDVMSITLWVMEYLSKDSIDSFGASEIAQYIVEKLGISTSRQAVHAALKKAASKKFCHNNKSGFSLMTLGQDELLKQMQKEKVLFIEPGKPFAAGMKIENIFSSMKGSVKISDPFVDIKTLDVIYRSLNIGIPIRILTVQVKNEDAFNREVQKLHHEGLDLEVRKISSGILHDRYFIDDNQFWLSGNSLNNLGQKESFIVMLGSDIRNSMIQTFDSRWQSSIAI